MQCQYSNCANVGVHSCSNCGKLVCGKHASIQHHLDNVIIKCQDCQDEASVRVSAAVAQEKQAEATLIRKAVPFWLLVVLGIIIFIIGAVQGWAAPMVIIGIVIGAIGLGGTFIFSEMSPPVKVGCLGLPFGIALLGSGLVLGISGLTTFGIFVGCLGLLIAIIAAIAQGLKEE